MEQSDYLLRQMQLMMQAFAALIRKLTGMKEESSEDELRKQTDIVLMDQMGMPLSELLQIPSEKIAAWLATEKQIHPGSMELLAEVLFIVAEKINDQHEKIKMLEASMALLTYVDSHGNTYSASRQSRIDEIARRLGRSA